MPKKPSPVLLAALALAAALLLAACGGGSGGSSSTSATTAPPPAAQQRGEVTAKAEGAGQRQGAKGKSQGGGSAGPEGRHHVPVAPLKVSGGGSAQFKVKGGDNSVQEYGAEGGESELRQAAETVHSFYVARVAEEWSRACSYLAAHEVQSLEQLGSQSPQMKGKGCPAVLAAFTQQISPSLQRQLTTVDAAALRTEGEQAFLIYVGAPGRTVYAMPLRSEGGKWKVGALSASALPGAK